MFIYVAVGIKTSFLIAEWYSNARIHHILLISNFSWGSSYLLATVKSAGISICVRVFVWILVFSLGDTHLWVELVGHGVILCLVSLRAFLRGTVFHSGVSILHYHQPCTQVEHFSISSPTLAIFWFFIFRYGSECEVGFQCVFDLHFSND